MPVQPVEKSSSSSDEEEALDPYSDLEDIEGVRLFLARHGETALNAFGLLRGRLDPELNANGLRQATRLGELLGRPALRLVVASPLQRAIETARAVALRVGLEVTLDAGFNDRDYGPWAGVSLEDVNSQWGSIDNAPHVEPSEEVRLRAFESLGRTAQRIERGSGVVVSHDAVNRLLLATIDPRLEPVSAIPQRTGCYNILEWNLGVWSVLSVDNVPPV